MHALVVRVSINDAESTRKTLNEKVVPQISKAPGFVAGYWTWSDDESNGQSMIVFESADDARTAGERIRSIASESGGAATVESAEVREVVASA
jgi:hypothetical protein